MTEERLTKLEIEERGFWRKQSLQPPSWDIPGVGDTRQRAGQCGHGTQSARKIHHGQRKAIRRGKIETWSQEKTKAQRGRKEDSWRKS